MPRTTLALTVLLVVVGGCVSPAGEPLSTMPPAPSPSVTTSSTARPSITTTTIAPAEAITATAPSHEMPDYVVAGPGGVFRVVDGVVALVMDKPDVAWAEDDGMGGLVFAALPTDLSQPNPVEWLPAGSAAPSVIVENVIGCMGGLAQLEGNPHVVTMREAPDHVSLITVLHNLGTDTERTFDSGPHGGHLELRPDSMAGSYGIDTDWSMSAEEPPGARLVFTDISGQEIQIEHNPWPDVCLGCGLWARLSPDGALLALEEFRPEPDDLGVAGWSEFLELQQGEQWTRWFAARRTEPVTLRIIDLANGQTLNSHTLISDPDSIGCCGCGDEPHGDLGDFDGRFAYLAACPRPVWPCLLDTHTGLEVDIVWGAGEPGTLRLFSAGGTEPQADGS